MTQCCEICLISEFQGKAEKETKKKEMNYNLFDIYLKRTSCPELHEHGLLTGRLLVSHNLNGRFFWRWPAWLINP